MERVDDRRADDAAWEAISYAGATKDTWIGEKPYADWDWLESPEDLTVEDRYAQQEADDGDGDLESTPTAERAISVCDLGNGPLQIRERGNTVRCPGRGATAVTH